MRKRTAGKVILRVAAALVLANSVEVLHANPGDETRVFTIHVSNYAAVEHGTLNEAEKVATEIFRKAGVESRWVDTPVGPQDSSPVSAADNRLSQLRLSILSPTMTARIAPEATSMGLAPGAGADRLLVYVFYGKVESLSNDLMATTVSRHCPPVSRGLILGQAIAHEIGHILLNLAVHSPTGIMRGTWDSKDFENAMRGNLVFTAQQAETIRAEVARRAMAREQIDETQSAF